METRRNKTLTTIAICCIVFGIIVAFIDLKKLCINTDNDGYVGSLFSLAGVILFFSALMYQIKEYKAQIQELKNSVDAQKASVVAQTKSSEALDEQRKLIEDQKQLLLEQNASSNIFKMIESFNEFYTRNDLQIRFEAIIKEVVIHMEGVWSELQSFDGDNEQLNMKFAESFHSKYKAILPTHDSYVITKQYVKFAYNILYYIDQKQDVLQGEYFKFHFLNQLNIYDNFILYISSLPFLGMPRYNNLVWTKEVTGEILELYYKLAKVPSLGYAKNPNIESLSQAFVKLKE